MVSGDRVRNRAPVTRDTCGEPAGAPAAHANQGGNFWSAHRTNDPGCHNQDRCQRRKSMDLRGLQNEFRKKSEATPGNSDPRDGQLFGKDDLSVLLLRSLNLRVRG
jgi:hypothetical protein